jgi:hypothetical protein
LAKSNSDKDVSIKKISLESGLASFLNKMNIADIEDEMGNFRRYKKYEKIDESERKRMLELVKSGFNPASVEVDSS